MNTPQRDDIPEREPPLRASSIDGQLLARAAEINEAVAGEFAERVVARLENPLIDRMAELGVETEAAVSVALKRAHRVAFHMRRGRAPHDEAELSDDTHALSAADRAQVAALAVAWWTVSSPRYERAISSVAAAAGSAVSRPRRRPKEVSGQDADLLSLHVTRLAKGRAYLRRVRR